MVSENIPILLLFLPSNHWQIQIKILNLALRLLHEHNLRRKKSKQFTFMYTCTCNKLDAHEVSNTTCTLSLSQYFWPEGVFLDVTWAKIWRLLLRAIHSHIHQLILLPPQRRQSAKLFLQSSELGLPNPSPAGECAYPPPLVPGGGSHSLAREGVGTEHWDRYPRVSADRENWNWAERRR